MSDINLTSDELRKLNQSLADLANSVNNGSRSFGPFADEQAAAAASTAASKEKTKAALKQFADQLGHTAIDLSKSMVSGGEGTAKYGTAVEGTTNAIGDLASKLGVFGTIVGGIIKIFGGLASASLKQNDQLMKSYRELSDMGSVTGSLEKLQEDFHKVGLTTDEYQKFGAMLKGVTPQLATFGGSVSEGKDKLVGVIKGMIGPNNQIEIAMGRIGYGADEMRDATASYVSQQSKLGLSQGKTTEQLRKESVSYMISLRELGELTGLQRDEAQKLMDQQQQDARFAITLRKIEQEQGHDAMMRAKTAMTAYEARFGKESAGDLMEQIANKGAIVGQASARGYQATMGENYRAFNDVVAGRADTEAMLDRTSKGVNKNLDRLGNTFMIAGKSVGDVVGSDQLITGSMEQAAKKKTDVHGKILDDMANGGARLNQNIDIEQRNRAMRIAADSALMQVGNLTVSMFQKLNDAMFKFGKVIAKMVDKFGKYVGMGETNLSDQFRDQDDNAQDLKEATSKSLARTNLERISEASQDYNNALNGTTKSLKTQMTAQEELVDKLKKDSKDDNLSELERAKAKVRYDLEKKRYDAMDEEFAASKGFTDLDKVKALRRERLNAAEKEEIERKEKIKKLEEEKIKMNQDGTGGGASGSPLAGSPGHIAKYAPGTASGYGQTQAMPSVKSREETLGTAKLEDIIKFGGGTGDKAHFESLDPNVANAFVAMAKDYFDKTGKQLQVNSAFRSPEEQANVNSGNNPKAAPGKSLHNVGRALDINSDQVKALLSSGALEKYGFKPLEGDPPHIQYGARDGGIFDGPSTGYPVMLHGNEAVIPMPNLEEFTESVKKEALGASKDTDLNKVITKSESSSVDTGGVELLADLLTGKFEDMINQLESANDTLKNLLTYAKA